MTVMTNPAEPLLDLLSPNFCPECGQLVTPQGTQLADAIAASFASTMRMLMGPRPSPEAPERWSAQAHGHRHSRRHPREHHHGRGRGDCGCEERGHDDCADCGGHGHGHGRPEHGWRGHDWPEHGRPEHGQRGHDCHGHDWRGQDCHGHDWRGHDCHGHDWQRHHGKEGCRRRDCWACDDDCRSCEDDRCECRCCIPRCDLLVYGRLGETRVVPFVIENRRHREREIALHISDWKTVGGGSADVTTVELEPATFELKPCSRRIVQLRFSIAAEERREVETCVVACADLTVDGCDMKPLRIAVAILPLECGPYCIDCSCGCC